MNTNKEKLLLVFFSLFFAVLSFHQTFSQEEDLDAFREFEERNTTTTAPSKEYDNNFIQNPLTFLPAESYLLKGIIITSNWSSAIVGSQEVEIQDQVVSIGDTLGAEGWVINLIGKDSISLGEKGSQNTSSILILHLVD